MFCFANLGFWFLCNLGSTGHQRLYRDECRWRTRMHLGGHIFFFYQCKRGIQETGFACYIVFACLFLGKINHQKETKNFEWTV